VFLKKRIELLVVELSKLLLHNQWRMVLAESCTGGQLASALTQLPGSSDWFEFSLVTYSNEAKKQYLAVNSQVLEEDGPVSSSCVMHMLKGIMHQDDYFGIAITGYAGPGGGTPSHPTGTVFIAWQAPTHTPCYQVYQFSGSRQEVVLQAVYYALRQAVLMSLRNDRPSLHYFFALVCEDESTSEQCHQIALAAGFEIAQLEPKSNLHVTLSYLGKVNELQLQNNLALAEALSRGCSSLELHGKELCYWEKPDAYVYALEPAKELLGLAEHLDAKQNFKPHMTISKKAKIAGQEIQLGRVDFKATFSRIVLLASFQGVFYLEKMRWSFKDV
jgi:nicotinamide-nucleotide amidase